MKIKNLIILSIGAVVIGISAITVSAEEINRTNDVAIEVNLIEEQGSEEPMLIEPSPYIEPFDEEIISEEEIIPLTDRGIPVSSDTLVEDGSEISLISQAESKNIEYITNSDTPIFLIIGTVGVLVILLLVINRKK